MSVATLLEGLISLSEASLRLEMNRERVLRRIQDGTLGGQLIAGRWHVSKADCARLLRERNGASTSTGGRRPSPQSAA